MTSHDVARVLPKNTLTFVASPQAPLVEEEVVDVMVLEDTFVAASENGFMLRRGDVDVHCTWCTGVPYLVSARCP